MFSSNFLISQKPFSPSTPKLSPGRTSGVPGTPLRHYKTTRTSGIRKLSSTQRSQRRTLTSEGNGWRPQRMIKKNAARKSATPWGFWRTTAPIQMPRLRLSQHLVKLKKSRLSMIECCCIASIAHIVAALYFYYNSSHNIYLYRYPNLYLYSSHIYMRYISAFTYIYALYMRAGGYAHFFYVGPNFLIFSLCGSFKNSCEFSLYYFFILYDKSFNLRDCSWV